MDQPTFVEGKASRVETDDDNCFLDAQNKGAQVFQSLWGKLWGHHHSVQLLSLPGAFARKVAFSVDIHSRGDITVPHELLLHTDRSACLVQE